MGRETSSRQSGLSDLLSPTGKIALKIYESGSRGTYFAELARNLRDEVSRFTINKALDQLLDSGFITGQWVVVKDKHDKSAKAVRSFRIAGEFPVTILSAFSKAIDSVRKSQTNVDVSRRALALFRKPKILFLAANPKNTVRLRLDEEIREVEQRILLAQKKDQLILVNKGAVRIGDLQFYLNQEKPTIVHFCGHGTCEGRIMLEDNRGRSKTVPSRALERVFRILKDDIECVVLNACFSAEQARAISQHIGCVIGMSSSISDEAARAFSSAFYLAVAMGRSIKDAFEQGVNELMLWEIPEENIPQLLSRKDIDPSDVFIIQSSYDR